MWYEMWLPTGTKEFFYFKFSVQVQFDVLLWPLVFHCNFSNYCYSGGSEAGVCIPLLPTPDTSTLRSSYEIECDC